MSDEAHGVKGVLFMQWLKEILENSSKEELEDKIMQYISENYVEKSAAEENGSDFKQKEELERNIAQLKEELRKSKIDSELDKLIMNAGGRNVKAIKALINMDKVEIDEDGNITGVDIEAIKQECPYLFNIEESYNEGTGVNKSTKRKSSVENDFIKSLFN